MQLGVISSAVIEMLAGYSCNPESKTSYVEISFAAHNEE